MKLDGTSKQAIVSSGMTAPNSLVIDLVSSSLYWTDGSHIQTSDLEGENLTTGLTVYCNTLYWAEWVRQRIATCTTAGSNEQTLVNDVTITAAIHIMDKSKQSRCCEYNNIGHVCTGL